MNQYVIAYDIANKKRLVRLHRYLQQHATPIQQSIFLFYGSELQKMACITGALRLLNPKEDSLCCYRLPSQGRKLRIGAKLFPEGVFFAPVEMQTIAASPC